MKKKGNKYLVFYTSHEQFAISINDIVIIEKVDYLNQSDRDNRIKKVKSYPNYIEGVFALKSKIIPVIEFEYLLSGEKMYRHNENKIIVIKGESIEFGILVNDVHSIVELNPDTFIQLYKEFPIYMTEKEGEVYIIPDLDSMLKQDDLKDVIKDVRSKLSDR